MLNKIIELGFSKTEAQELLKVSKDIEKDYIKLKKGYPIQYLIGYVNFYGNKILVNSNVLIPRFETELLVEKTIKYCKKYFNKKIDILDLCTGSGNIAISLKKEIDSNVNASDISNSALDLAKENIKINNVDINVINSDLFSNITQKFDVIISNPPYISYDEEIDESVKEYEPNLALFAKNNGLYFYEEILKNIKNYLNEDYLICFEIGMTEGNAIKEIANKYLTNITISIEKDYSGKDRFVFIKSE